MAALTTFDPTEPVETPFDVVAVGAHPDDVEIACGGTLARLAQQGYRVGIVDLTDGEPTPGSPSPDVRLEEAEKAAQVLGITSRWTLHLTNRMLFDTFETRVELAKVFRCWRPRIVIGFGAKTPMASPDHWQAMQITDAAVFYSRLTKWDERFGGLPPHAVTAQLYFHLNFHTLEIPPGAGHFVTDITPTLEQKIESIHCYQTQFPEARAYIFERVKAIAVQQGSTAGFAAGELFFSTRTLGTRDLVQTVLGN